MTGFDQDRILECHGSIHFHQCVDTESYGSDVWPAPDTLSPVDMATLNMADPLPTKPGSEGNIAARPNILMFNDYTFSDQRIDVQYDNLNDFMAKVMEAGKSCCVIEVGAGTAIPTIRMRGEQWARQYERVTLVRINPGEFKVPKAKNVISIPLGGLDALRALDALVSK
ncbi:hypothetical protein HK101_010190 [Irineochytrium annulatum]|nr:hypothetical protein HK101_010190 [Irineochytrium annulatum]